jgi:hypothetical protein
MNLPDHAMVLYVDENRQIQALDRTQPELPMKRGRCGTFTHDYERHGTTTLFAALNDLEGTVIGECYQRHRHQEFLKFLRQLNRALQGQDAASDCRQLRHSQTSQRTEMVSQPPAVSAAFHTDALRG